MDAPAATSLLCGIPLPDLLDAAFWRQALPELTITEKGRPASAPPPPGLACQTMERLSARMARDGYFGERVPGMEAVVQRLAVGVQACVQLGLPPVFVWLTDEPWDCYAGLDPVLEHFLGEDYRLLPDFWAWHVDPARQQRGWKPHRDKGSQALAPDGSPLSLTVWIPLTEATPLNGCMYIIPAHLDSTYGTVEEHRLKATPENIRALPARPGEYLCWNQCVFHWGAAASEFATGPRMSMALEFQRGNREPFNKPLLPARIVPNFTNRLRLIGKQILQYQHMYGFSEELTGAARIMIEAPPPPG